MSLVAAITLVSIVGGLLLYVSGYWAGAARRGKPRTSNRRTTLEAKAIEDANGLRQQLEDLERQLRQANTENAAALQAQEQLAERLNADHGKALTEANEAHQTQLDALKKQMLGLEQEASKLRSTLAAAPRAETVRGVAQLRQRKEGLEDELGQARQELLRFRRENQKLREQAAMVDQLGRVQREVRRQQDRWREAEQKAVALQDELEALRRHEQKLRGERDELLKQLQQLQRQSRRTTNSGRASSTSSHRAIAHGALHAENERLRRELEELRLNTVPVEDVIALRDRQRQLENSARAVTDRLGQLESNLAQSSAALRGVEQFHDVAENARSLVQRVAELEAQLGLERAATTRKKPSLGSPRVGKKVG